MLIEGTADEKSVGDRNGDGFADRLVPGGADLAWGFDFMRAEAFLYSPLYVRSAVVVHGAERLRAAVARGGAVLASLHYGNYFLIGGGIAHQLGLAATGIVTDANLTILPKAEEAVWRDMYRKAEALQGAAFFVAGRTPKADIVDDLRQPGHVVWSMLDVREFGRERPESAFEFDSRTIYLQTGTARLARLAGVPVVPVCIKYEVATRQHHLFIGTAIPPTVDAQSITQQALHQIEAMIGDDRAQFFHGMEYFAKPSPASARSNGFGMLFDQYSRYKACEALLGRAGVREGCTMLDIGSGPESLFEHFLPGVKKTFIDPLIAEGAGPNKIRGDLSSPALASLSFDAVSAVDVLEHIPAADRRRFVEQVSSCAERVVVLGFPAGDEPGAVEADRRIDEAYVAIAGHSYPWLLEHEAYGLPSLHETVAQLREHGWHCQVVGHGHVPWLTRLLPLVLSVWDRADFHEYLLEVSLRFNREFATVDFRPPYYRHFIVATREPLANLQIQPAEADAAVDSRFESFMTWVHDRYLAVSLRRFAETDEERGQLQVQRRAVEAERDAAQAERARLKQQIHDLLGSRSWRVTRPLRLLARVAHHGLVDSDRRELFDLLRRVYRRLPLGQRGRRRVAQLARWLRLSIRRRRVGHWVEPERKPAPSVLGLPDYFVFGVIDWHFRHQRPQQMALQLAASGRRVFYLSVLFVDRDEAGFELEPLDVEGRLFNIRLYLRGAPPIYEAPASSCQLQQLKLGLSHLLAWAKSSAVVALLQHPYWRPVAAAMPDSRLIYDCMDHHEGFGSVTADMLAQERALFEDAELVVTTSAWLESAVQGKVLRCTLIRNAGAYDHFSAAPADCYVDPLGRRIIGYFGAIAEWFDVELVGAVAAAFPDCCVLLIGADTVQAQQRLAGHANVTFLGEVAYSELPRYAHAIDVCLLPFKIQPLTLATNPVKVYEYLSMGKPVVAVELPEMQQFGDLCRVTADVDAFVSAVRDGLLPSSADEVAARQAFAREQTWAHRAAALVHEIEANANDPRISVVVVTFNNLQLTQQCLSSLDAYSGYPNLEVIVVDNASSDGSPAWLQQWAEAHECRRLILNADNRGFAAANNQGLELASGEYLVMLNNDTHVTPGWARTLMQHMRRDPGLGLLGPVTNNIGNEARIDLAYDDMSQMIERASDYTRQHMGQLYALRTAAFFCVMLRRETFEKVGPLDEAFGRGFFEDDDYCRRVEQIGLRIACAEDVFVHHHLSASFNKLKHQERQKLFEENKRVYEAKWGPWVPHRYREEGGPNG